MEEQNYILFESYLSNTLSEAERTAFELKLKTEKEFKQTFHTYKEVSAFLDHKISNEAQSAAFQDNLKTISTTYFENLDTPKKVIRFKPWQYAVAASIAFLMGIFIFNTISKPSFYDYNDYEIISLTVRGGQDELVNTAQTAFNTKDFAKAEEAFRGLLASNDTNSELKLYRAIALIELNDFGTADALLKDLGTGVSVYKNKALWYLALSKLKQGDEKACSELLKEIPEAAEDYKEAQKLLKKLD